MSAFVVALSHFSAHTLDHTNGTQCTQCDRFGANFDPSEGTSAWDFSPKSHKWRAKCSEGAVKAVLAKCAEFELSRGMRGFDCCVVVVILQLVALRSVVSMLFCFAVGQY